jgi:hypothetical protein
MAQRNLADPAYEPSDEDLAVLMREAFANVKRQRAVADEALRERISVERARTSRHRRTWPTSPR